MTDMVEKEYWDKNWSPVETRRIVFPEKNTLRNHSYHMLHLVFERLFALHNNNGTRRLIEFGCAQSIWLPYFARHFGFKVFGLDYSERGCELASNLLKQENVDGTVIHADFMDAPTYLQGQFDVGVSFGVAEHFEDTTECLKAFSKYLKPGGILITVIPNMVGLNGVIQKRFDREIYDIHALLDANLLVHAHRKAGLDPILCEYIVCSNFGVITFSSKDKLFTSLKRIVRLGLMSLSLAGWAVERSLGRSLASKTLSPYIVCAATF